MMCWISFVIFWIACGVATTAAMNAYFRAKFSYIRHSDEEGWFNLSASMLFGLAGPIGLLVITFMTGLYYHGFTLRWRSEEEE